MSWSMHTAVTDMHACIHTHTFMKGIWPIFFQLVKLLGLKCQNHFDKNCCVLNEQQLREYLICEAMDCKIHFYCVYLGRYGRELPIKLL